MPPKAGGGKSGAAPAAAGMKTMMSFFQKAPTASPPAEKKLAEGAGGADDAVTAILSPVVTDKTGGSPGTASSGAKTADRATARENVEGVRRKRLLDSSDEEEEGSASASNNTRDSGASGPRGGSSLAKEAFAAAKAAKADALVARVGQAVDVLRGGSLGGAAEWQKGSLVRQNISGRWQVAMDDGGKCEVTIPNEKVRLIAGSGASPAKSSSSATQAPAAKNLSASAAAASAAPAGAGAGQGEGNSKKSAAPAKPGKRACTGNKKKYIASSDEESVADGEDSDFKMGDAASSDDDDDAEMHDDGASDNERAAATQSKPRGKKSKAVAQGRASEEPSRVASKMFESSTPKTKVACSPASASPFVPKPVSSSVKSAFAAKACDQNTVSEAKKAKNDKFEAANKDRYRWLLDIMDAKKRRPTDEGYDGRTLYIPQTAYAGFSNFEKQFWDIKKVCRPVPCPQSTEPSQLEPITSCLAPKFPDT